MACSCDESRDGGCKRTSNNVSGRLSVTAVEYGLAFVCKAVMGDKLKMFFV
ncbi:hypothetical protein THIOM_000850 [Candidatus Thiomargarita nelsonii]|uniref:Uncharacterized protein n=1 Tax=Candidatus Thiomargarita nelsonii TaxID=1003181 RepID=A0A176S5B9_9GAMM|nr:hypothetical protein THIOM_000850 [Candidatus Thiomargarita nelsonii]